MSRIGKLLIQIPDQVEVKIDADFVIVKGPKGELKQKLVPEVKIEIIDKNIEVKVDQSDDKKQRSLWGTFRQLINNMVVGVSQGFVKKLEVNGVGYRVAVQNGILVLSVGYSHPVNFSIPPGINIGVEKNTITIEGANKHLVGETAAQIRRIRKPEPYKGKGIKYADEIIRRKAGKQAKGAK